MLPMPELKILSNETTSQAQANERGKFFEDLMRRVLRRYGYKIKSKSINYAGMEIDIEGEHEVSGHPLYAECKFYDKSIDAPKLQAFFGKYMALWMKDNHASGLFIAVPGLNSHATAFYEENCQGNSKITVRLLEKREVLDAIFEVDSCVRPESIASQIPAEIGIPGDQVLTYTKQGFFWFQYVIPMGGVIPQSVAIFDAKGVNIRDKESLNTFQQLYPEVAQYNILNLKATPLIQSTMAPDLEQIVEVKAGSACFEYQFPAHPDYFVGRTSLFAEIDKFVTQVLDGKTSARGLIFTANSGWGKSSCVLAVVDRLNKAGHFALAVDSRTASSPQFILRVCDYVFNEKFRNLLPQVPFKVTGYEGAVDALGKLGKVLAQQRKILVIFLDQFENIFFQVDALRHIKDMFLKLCDLQTNIALGFSWKTDIVGQINDFPYQLREDLTAASLSIPLGIFSNTEAKELFQWLEKEIGTSLREDLKFFLSEYSQGYPWLLKKLCAHVKSQYETSVPQADLATSLLNVEQIFRSDMQGLLAEEEDTLRSIARLAPINATDLGDEFNPSAVQALVNRRLVVRVGNKYDIYWDIFRDYLNTGRIPVQEHYILRIQAGTVIRATRSLFEQVKKGMEFTSDQFRDHLANHHRIAHRTFYNVFHEMKLLGLVTLDDMTGILGVPQDLQGDDAPFEQSLQKYLYDRLTRNRLILRYIQHLEVHNILDINLASRLLRKWCPYISASSKTWQTYARIFAGWMKATGLADFDNKQGRLVWQEPDMMLSEYSLLDVELGKRRGVGLPAIQYKPIEQVLLRIVEAAKNNSTVDTSNIKRSSWSKVLASLEELGFIVRRSRTIGVLPVAIEFADNPRDRKTIFSERAMQIQPFSTFVAILHDADSNAQLTDIAQILKLRLGVDWTDGTAEVNAKIMLNWARHLDLAPAHLSKKKTHKFTDPDSDQQSLF
ncbi:MAG: restriction endonuclease [Anaerolineales bacterium]|nr:restriction endonuclease [Anaerolineales bacterium]